jgi:uncharacterized membrane protein YciS (DUF1049 family)
MSVSRIGLFLISIAILVSVAIQNNSPTLTLVFLGMRSQPFSLGILILAAFGCGVATGWVLIMLLRLNGYLTKRQGKTVKPKKEYLESPDDDDEPEPFQPTAPARGWGQFQRQPEPEPEQAPWDDWQDAEEPKTVYDADFRVIRPPQPSDDSPTGEADNDLPPRRRKR